MSASTSTSIASRARRVEAVIGGAGAKDLQAVHSFRACCATSSLAAIALRVAFEMTVEARRIDTRSQPGRRRGALARSARHAAVVHGEEVACRRPSAPACRRRRRARRCRRRRRVGGAGVLTVAVVLVHENRRQLQHDGHVHGLEHRALIARRRRR